MTGSDSKNRAELEDTLAQARKLVDLALDELSLAEIQKLVAEIEAELAGNDNDVP